MIMPSHRVHRAVNKLVTGDAHNEVNRAVDWPAPIMGPGHRVFGHGLQAPIVGAVAAAAAGKDPVSGAVAGVTHDLTDRAFSALPAVVRQAAEPIVVELAETGGRTPRGPNRQRQRARRQSGADWFESHVVYEDRPRPESAPLPAVPQVLDVQLEPNTPAGFPVWQRRRPPSTPTLPRT
jgi:hypothetical protein